MAELLRKREKFREAERYARIALRLRARRANLTLANIYFAWALKFQSEGQASLAEGRLKEALEALSAFTPEFGHDQEVVDCVGSKILCALGDIEGARGRVMKYGDSPSPYTTYEQCRVLSAEAEIHFGNQRYEQGIAALRSAIQRIEVHSQKHAPPQQLLDQLIDLRAREAQARSAIG